MKLRRRKVLGADDSTSSDEEGERAVRGSDPVVMVTDDSDSKSGYCIPKRGKRPLVVYCLLLQLQMFPYMLCCPQLWPSILFLLRGHSRITSH